MFNKSLLAACLASLLTSVAAAQTVDNWVSSSGEPVRSGSSLCWRDANWTPATAAPGCDGAIVKPSVQAKVAAPVEAPKAVAAPEVPVVKQVVDMHFTASADVFFDFDRAVLKPEGKKALDKLVKDIANIDVEVIVSSGHTDSIGSKAYNAKLSERRAQAVRAYLVSKGISKSKVMVHGYGKSKPVATNKTSAGRAKNRRVELEIVGAKR